MSFSRIMKNVFDLIFWVLWGSLKALRTVCFVRSCKRPGIPKLQGQGDVNVKPSVDHKPLVHRFFFSVLSVIMLHEWLNRKPKHFWLWEKAIIIIQFWGLIRKIALEVQGRKAIWSLGFHLDTAPHSWLCVEERLYFLLKAFVEQTPLSETCEFCSTESQCLLVTTPFLSGANTILQQSATAHSCCKNIHTHVL